MDKTITSPLSGFRDLLPEQMISRQKVLQAIERVYQLYGFLPLETPILERFEVLMGKYGEEGDKLMYTFKDQGGRDVALRYDQTVPLARVVAEYRGKLPNPFKRYVIGPVFRGDSPQKGRYRQFTQFDIDVVGTASLSADAEIIAAMSDSIKALGARGLIRVNNRRVLDALAQKVGLSEEMQMRGLVGIIDKIDKIGKEKVLGEVKERFGEKVSGVVDEYLCVSGSVSDKIVALGMVLGESGAAKEGLESIQTVFDMLRASGYSEEQVVFDPTIARGLDYYTGTIYEGILIGAEEFGSVCAGGRYDNLIKVLGGPDMPAVGVSIGVDRLLDGLGKLGKLEQSKTTTQVIVANFGGVVADYMRIATLLRENGIAAEFVYDDKKNVGNQIKAAAEQGVLYAVLYGEDEMKKGVVTIRDLKTREQEEVRVEDVGEKMKER